LFFSLCPLPCAQSKSASKLLLAPLQPLPVSCHSRPRLWITSSSILLSHLLGPDKSPLHNLHSTEQEVIRELLLRPVPRRRFFENTVSKLRKFSSDHFFPPSNILHSGNSGFKPRSFDRNLFYRAHPAQECPTSNPLPAKCLS
jgi:hypothetical protein